MKICPQCNKPFTPSNRKQKYCSKNCGVNARSKKWHLKHPKYLKNYYRAHKTTGKPKNITYKNLNWQQIQMYIGKSTCPKCKQKGYLVIDYRENLTTSNVEILARCRNVISSHRIGPHTENKQIQKTIYHIIRLPQIAY